MTEHQDKSSLPILLTIAGILVAIVGVGWLFLYQDPPEPISADEPGTEPANVRIEPLEAPAPDSITPESESSPEPATGDAPVTDDAPTVDIEGTFRKARLAAGADNLAYPAGRSALHFYAQILAAEPDNAIAQAELDAVLSRIETTATAHLSAGEYADAFDLAVAVADIRPGHALVQQVQQTIDDLSDDLVSEAVDAARRGDDQAATDAIRAAQQLPGRDADYIAAVRASIADIVAARRAAETQRAESARRAAAQALSNAIARIRTAILEGRLIEPAGNNARELLAATTLPDDERTRLTAELTAMLLAESGANIQRELLPEAEALLDAAAEFDADPEQLTELRNSLEQAYVTAESGRILSTSEFVQTKRVNPRYPRRASDRNISGWVEIYFTVTSDGTASDIEVVASDPPDIFDQAAVRAVQQWEFEPREYRGQLIDQRAGVRLVFDLE
ncbi:MAG: energy transducer TonB [Gammaproteobacteria bacterium]|nr:energy transducer TonB [Gammaproteobacteria bacterium]